MTQGRLSPPPPRVGSKLQIQKYKYKYKYKIGNDDSAALTVQADHPPAYGEAPDRAIKWGW